MKTLRTYKDLNMAMKGAYTLINWLLANYDHTMVTTRLNVWQYPSTKEWFIEVITISQSSIVIPDKYKPSIPDVHEFECEGKHYFSKSYEFTIKQ